MGSSAAYFGLGAPRGANAGQRAESDSGQKAAAGEIARNIRPGDPTGGTTTGEKVGGGVADGAADGGGLVDYQAALGVEQRTGDPDGKERRRKPRRRSEVAAEGIGPPRKSGNPRAKSRSRVSNRHQATAPGWAGTATDCSE